MGKIIDNGQFRPWAEGISFQSTLVGISFQCIGLGVIFLNISVGISFHKTWLGISVPKNIQLLLRFCYVRYRVVNCQCYILSPSKVCPRPTPSVKSLKLQGLRMALMQPDVLNWFYEPFLCFKPTFIFEGNCMPLIFQIKSFGMRFQHLCLGKWLPSYWIGMKFQKEYFGMGFPRPMVGIVHYL